MNTFKKLLIISAITAFSFSVNGQTTSLKIGHINSQELLAAMPETDSAQKKLEKIGKEHELMLEEMTVELNKKYEDYLQRMQDTENPMSPLIRSSKEGELQELQDRISNYEESAQQDMQQQRMILFQPIQEKAIKAVNQVAEENGFTYILDTGVGTVVYTSPDSYDILPLVKEKLSIK